MMHAHRFPARPGRLLLAAWLITSMTSPSQAEVPLDTTVATVNGQAITGFELLIERDRRSQARRLASEPDDDTALTKQLVQRKLLADHARSLGLAERDNVQRVLVAAQDEALARLYADLVAPKWEPSKKDIREYYDAHPALFAKRRIYALQELQLQPSFSNEAELTKAVRKATSLQDLTMRAAELKLGPYTVQSTAQAAENLPLTIVDDMAAKADGTIFMKRTQSGGFAVVHIMGSRTQPVSYQDAEANIRQFLRHELRQAWMAEQIQVLQRDARVSTTGP